METVPVGDGDSVAVAIAELDDVAKLDDVAELDDIAELDAALDAVLDEAAVPDTVAELDAVAVAETVGMGKHKGMTPPAHAHELSTLLFASVALAPTKKGSQLNVYEVAPAVGRAGLAAVFGIGGGSCRRATSAAESARPYTRMSKSVPEKGS